MPVPIEEYSIYRFGQVGLNQFSELVLASTKLNLPDGTTRDVDVICINEADVLGPLFVVVDGRWGDLLSNPFVAAGEDDQDGPPDVSEPPFGGEPVS